MMQREEVIDSASQVSDDQDFAMANTMEHLKSTEPLKRMFAMGRIKRSLANYQDDDPTNISSFDRNLLKGFYTKDKWELVNDSEKESLKFAAKIDKGRALGLIKHYWKHREIKNPDLRAKGIDDNRKYAVALHDQYQNYAFRNSKLKYSDSFILHK